MKSSNLIWFITLRNCFRDKKNFMILVVGVSISIAMIIISSASSNSLIKEQKESVKQVTGDWHMAFLYNDDKVIKEIKELDGVREVFQSFYIPDIYGENSSECFQLTAINKDKLYQFISIYKGRYPKNSYEILLPQWYLDKYAMSDLPCEILLHGQKMSVVGSFEVDYQKTSSQIPVYLAYEGNQILEQYSAIELPWGSVFESSFENREKSEKSILLVSLDAKTDVAVIEQAIEKINGVFPFQTKEAYGITEYEKEFTAWFNGDLISVDNFKNAGELTNQGLYSVQKKLHFLYRLIIVAVTVLFMITLINLKRKELLFQSGILKTMGIDSLELIKIENLYLALVIILSIPIGVLLGCSVAAVLDTFQYMEILSIIRDLSITFISFFVSGFLVMGYSLLITPINALNEASSDVSILYENIRWPNTIKNARLFRLKYALRNISIHRKRYIVLFCVIALLFSLFAISFTIVNFSDISGNGKEKCKYDVLIKKEDLDNHADDMDIVKQVRQIIGVEEVLAPLCYYDHFGEEEPDKQIIVKIPKEKLNEVLEKKLLLSNHESYVNKQGSYVMSNTGIIGCSTEELDYLKQYIVEGSINKMYNPKENYVLLPKYFESYENTNIPVSKYKVGDSIELCVTKEETNLLEPEFSNTKTFIIAGLVEYNPFYMSNGVSSELSVIINATQFESVVPGTANYIYIKANEALYTDVKNQLSRLEVEKNGYSIKDTRDEEFVEDMNRKSKRAEEKMMMLLVEGTILIILIGVLNLIFVKKMLRKDEIKLLRIVGISAKTFQKIDAIETVLYSVVGIVSGMLISIVILKRLKIDVIYRNIENIPWNMWIVGALSMLMANITFSIITSIYIETSIDIE